MEDTKRYAIKLNKAEELKAGRTNNYIAKLACFSRQYTSEIFVRKRLINKKTAEKIIKSVCNDVVSLKEKLNKEGIDKLIDYFFEKV